MQRKTFTLTLAILAAVALAAPLAAQDGPPLVLADRAERHQGGLLRCLKGLDLSDSQKADIKAILDAAKPTFEADAAAIKAAHQKLDADYDAGAGVSVIGQDYIDLRADIKKLGADRSATEDLVLAKLTTDQKTKAQACLDAREGRRSMFEPGS